MNTLKNINPNGLQCMHVDICISHSMAFELVLHFYCILYKRMCVQSNCIDSHWNQSRDTLLVNQFKYIHNPICLFVSPILESFIFNSKKIKVNNFFFKKKISLAFEYSNCYSNSVNCNHFVQFSFLNLHNPICKKLKRFLLSNSQMNPRISGIKKYSGDVC